METQTRQLTLEEMYFKKASKLHLSIPASQSLVAIPILEPGGSLHENPVQEAPALDLSKPVFSPASFSERTMKFINKNWIWILVGTGVLVGAAIWYRNQQEKKNKNPA